MSRPVIRLENVSKVYRLGELGTGTISNDFSRWWSKTVKGKDPFSKIGEENNEKKGEFWALKDVSFDVHQGDVLGIIGKNGAGKSTLLKILSRITSPTSGNVKIKGRIASLLEVGTGFHPDLTGRDNVYLNGSFLGMKKWEIDKRFDEIVDFSGIEKFIDTPVKRYSSGMYVRLAFAVAAHLDPEILIIDEVLAVGDAEFQKKCLGKMQDVSQNLGKTVLFVSHGMGVIQKLCNKAVLLKNGQIIDSGNTNKVIDTYLFETNYKSNEYSFSHLPKNEYANAYKLFIEDILGNSLLEIPVGKPWVVKVHFKVHQNIKNLVIGLGLIHSSESPIRTTWSEPKDYDPGTYVATFKEEKLFFATGKYRLVVGLSQNTKSIEYIDDNIWFFISEIVESKVVSVINTGSAVVLNQMEMSIEKLSTLEFKYPHANI